MKRNDMFWGTLLVVIGVILVLDRLFGISLGRVIWPVALIGMGCWLVWRSSQSHEPLHVEQVTVPLEGAEKVRVRVQHGVGALSVSGGAGPDALVAGTFVGMASTRKQSEGMTEVRLRTPSYRTPYVFMPWLWGGGGGLEWQMALNSDVPMELRVESGLSTNRLDLSDLQVTELRVQAGLSSTDLTMPARAGYTRARIEAGLASVTIHIPEGVSARIRTQEGLASTTVDQDRFPRVGDIYVSPDFEEAENKAEIEIQHGLGSVVVR